MVISSVRFVIGAVFIVLGLLVFAVEILGVFKFKYVMNRMHAAALGDTLGIGLLLVGLMIFNGLQMSTLKMLLAIFIFWFASPACSHLVARLEIATNKDAVGREYDEYTIPSKSENAAAGKEENA